MRLTSAAALAVTLVIAVSAAPRAQESSKPPLTGPDIQAIATLLKLEDTRQFDEATLGTLLKSAHPEVRRRAVLAVGRIAPKALPTSADSADRGAALLEPLRAEKDADILATVAFSTGQLKTAASIPWLAALLSSPTTPAPVAKEAACALGKFKNTLPAVKTQANIDAEAALGTYLTNAPLTAPSSVAGEALLSIGRFAGRWDIAPILRWTIAEDAEVRWRATWALFRPHNPASLPTILKLTTDSSPDVRLLAVRAVTPAVVDEAAMDRDAAAAQLRDALKDTDRRVRTEALRTLAGYDDDASLAVVMSMLDSPDTWLSVSAAEGLARFKAKTDVVVPKLVAAGAPGKPLALRLTVLASLTPLAPEKAAEIAGSVIRENSLYARTTAGSALQRLGVAGQAQLDALAADPATKSLVPAPPQGRGAGGGGRGNGAARPAPVALSDADYLAIVNRWIVPDYNGAPKPHAIWETPKGSIEFELYPGDAPMGMEYFVKSITSGDINGTEFTRVVPDFVDQQRGITNAPTLRDEVNRHGLVSGNLSWASAGLDTGRPGFTVGSAPQPHNEGDFTALGHVVKGLDVVDRIELGDAVTSARIIK